MKIVSALAIMILALSLLSCSKAEPTPIPTAIPTAIPTPTPTVSEKRVDTVQFLKSMNALSNNFNDTLENSGVMDNLGRGDLAAVLTGLSPVKLQIGGYVSQLNELKAPQSEPELSVILSAYRSSASDFRAWWVELSSALQAGNLALAGQVAQKGVELSASANVTEKRVQDLMARYNIPDAEVGYRYR